MTGFKSKKTAALDEEGMYLVHQTAQPAQEPPPWWPAVENILTEYGLQAIDFVADFKNAMKDAEQLAQNPDVVMHWDSHTWTTNNPPPKGSGDVNLYYAPAPPRPWVDLTDEDWEHIHDMRGTSLDNFSQGAVWAEAKLKERNA